MYYRMHSCPIFLIFVLLLCCVESSIFLSWPSTAKVASVNGTTCYFMWNNDGLNIGIYINPPLEVGSTVEIVLNLDSNLSTAPGEDVFEAKQIPYFADMVISYTTFPEGIHFWLPYGSTWTENEVNHTQWYQLSNLTHTIIELIINDSRVYSVAPELPKMNFALIWKDNSWISPPAADSYFGFLQKASPASDPAFTNSFPYSFELTGQWSNATNWLFSNTPYDMSTEPWVSNVIIKQPCTFDLESALVGHLSLRFSSSLNLAGLLHLGDGYVTSYLNLEMETFINSSVNESLVLHAPISVSAPQMTFPVDNLIIQPSNAGANSVNGPSSLEIRINNRLTVVDSVSVAVPITYGDYSTLEYSASGPAKFRSAVFREWIAVLPDSNSASMPVDVEVNMVNLDLNPPPSSTLEYAIRGNLAIQSSGNMTVSIDTSTLRIAKDVLIQPGGSLQVSTGTLIARNIDTVGLSCGPTASIFSTANNDTRPFPFLDVFNSGTLVEATYTIGPNEMSSFHVNGSEWSSVEWFLGNVSFVNGSYMDTSSAGQYTVVAIHIATQCKSNNQFEVDKEDFPSSPSAQPDPNKKIFSNVLPLLIAVIAIAAIVGSIIAFVIFRKRRRRRRQSARTKDEEKAKEPQTELTPQEKRKSEDPSKRPRTNEIDYSEIKIGKELGRGAFGIVYKGRWRNTDCVVKQMDASRTDEQSIKLFMRETQNVQNAGNHPNVCVIFGVCTNPEYPICIVMEYLAGGSLDNMLYNDTIKIDAKIAIEFGKNIAGGMSHLHKENILHCDLGMVVTQCVNWIAARNLLVTQVDGKYVLKIADFGLSKMTETDTYNASNSSTFPIRWTPPEALRGGKVTRAFDVWSFGVVMWEIIECKKPYPGMSNTEVINQVCDHGYRLPMPQRVPIPDDLFQLMQKCWAGNPEERPSFDSIYEELEDIYEKFYPEPVPNDNKTGSKTQDEDFSTSGYQTQPTTTKSIDSALYGNKE